MILPLDSSHRVATHTGGEHGDRSSSGRIALEEVGVDFAWPRMDEGMRPLNGAATHANEAPHPEERDLVLIGHLHQFIGRTLMRRTNGRLRSLRVIGSRLIAFTYLLDPGMSKSLADDARQLGVSRAWLSRTAKEFLKLTGLQPSKGGPRKRKFVRGAKEDKTPGVGRKSTFCA